MEYEIANGSSVELSDRVFSADFNEGLVHQAVVAYMAGSRLGTKAQKTRSMVRGGGAKPFKQKGTGRARAGTIRSPLWRSGGVVFAASNRNYQQKLNKKMYRSAMRSIFSELLRQDRLTIVEDFALDAPKTKLLIEKMSQFEGLKTLLVCPDFNVDMYLASRNSTSLACIDVSDLNPFLLVGYEKVVVMNSAIAEIEGLYQ